MNTLMTYFYFSIIEMLNAATRTPRSGNSPNFVHAMNNDIGLANNRRSDPFSFPANDKTGAHSIAALDRYICDSKNGSIYSNNIKAAVGEAPTTVNPYIPTKTNKPLPQESFRYPMGKLANSCGCNRRRNQPEITTEQFCGHAFVENKNRVFEVCPIVLVILLIIGGILLFFIIKDKSHPSSRTSRTYNDEPKSESYESLIGGRLDNEADDPQDQPVGDEYEVI